MNTLNDYWKQKQEARIARLKKQAADVRSIHSKSYRWGLFVESGTTWVPGGFFRTKAGAEYRAAGYGSRATVVGKVVA